MKSLRDIPENKPFDVVGLGLNAVDYICLVDAFPTYNAKTKMSSFLRTPGGQAATAMTACVRWGLKARYIGTFGYDEEGSFSRGSLVSEGVDVSAAIIRPDCPNQAAFIIVIRGDGERTIVWHRSEDLTLQPDELDREAVTSGRILLVDGQNLEASILAARWAREAGIPVVLDAESTAEGTLELVRFTDILISDREFPEKLVGGTDREAALRKILAMGPTVACATLGEAGSLAVTRKETIRTRAFGIDCVDTTGAGDIFHAGFVYGMLREWDLERILDFANAAAGASCEGLGGRSRLFHPDRIVERFLDNRD